MPSVSWKASIVRGKRLLCAQLHSKHFPWHSFLTTHSASRGRCWHVQLAEKNTEAQLSLVTVGGWRRSVAALGLHCVASVLRPGRLAGHRNGWSEGVGWKGRLLCKQEPPVWEGSPWPQKSPEPLRRHFSPGAGVWTGPQQEHPGERDESLRGPFVPRAQATRGPKEPQIRHAGCLVAGWEVLLPLP